MGNEQDDAGAVRLPVAAAAEVLAHGPDALAALTVAAGKASIDGIGMVEISMFVGGAGFVFTFPEGGHARRYDLPLADILAAALDVAADHWTNGADARQPERTVVAGPTAKGDGDE
jgi:hypothetical protein